MRSQIDALRDSLHPPGSDRGLTLWVLAACFCLLSVCWPTLGQDVATQASEQADQGQLFANVNEALGEIRSERTNMGAAPDLATLRSQIDFLEERVASEVGGAVLVVPVARMSRGELRELRLALDRHRSTSTRYNETLSRALAKADAWRQSFADIREQWRSTRESAETVDLPTVLIEQVDGVIAEAEAAQRVATDRLGELVSLQTRSMALDSELRSLADQARTRERQLLSGFLHRDSAPLWKVYRQPEALDLSSTIDQMRAAVERGLEDLMVTYLDRVLFHLVLGALILGCMLALRRTAAAFPEADHALARRALGHPLVLSLVLTLAFTQLLYPTARPSVVTLSTMLFLVGELAILGMVLRGLGAGKLWLTGCYLVLTQAAQLVPVETAAHRLSAFAIAVGGIVLLAMTWQALLGFGVLASSWWRSVLRAALATMGVLLVTSGVANLVGAFGLASFLTDAVLRSYLAALGLLTLSLLLHGLAALVLSASLLQRLRSVREQTPMILELTRTSIVRVAAVLWLWATLDAFRLVGPIVGALRALLEASFEIGRATIAVGAILAFVLSIYLAVHISRLTRFIVDHDVLPRLSLPRGVPGAISTSIHYAIMAIGVLFGSAVVGLELSKLTLVAGALGVGIGFGLQNVVNNFFSGLILLFERPIQVGDHVQVGTLSGAVRRIGIRASVVGTYEGSEVIVPNADLISRQVVNYTLSDQKRRLELKLGVAYGSDLDHARTTIETALGSVDNVLSDPEPRVLFQGFGESSLDFQVLFWIPSFELGLETRSAVGLAIHRALKEQEIEVPFPQRDVHLRPAPPIDPSQPSPEKAEQPQKS